MIVRKALGFIALLSAVSLLPSRLLLHAQPPHPSEAVEAVWVAAADRLVKVGTDDGAMLLEIPDVPDVQALAVDQRREALWAYGQGSLRAYGFGGEPLIEVSVAPPEEGDEEDGQTRDDRGEGTEKSQGEDGGDEDEGGTRHVALLVDPEDGAVWLGIGRLLYGFDAQGRRLQTFPLSDKVRGLAWDPTASRLWVATQKTVRAYEDSGPTGDALELGPHPDVQDLAVDPETGALWLAMKKAVRRYDFDRLLTWEIPLDEPEWIAGDGQGGLWVSTAKTSAGSISMGRCGSPWRPGRATAGSSPWPPTPPTGPPGWPPRGSS